MVISLADGFSTSIFPTIPGMMAHQLASLASTSSFLEMAIRGSLLENPEQFLGLQMAVINGAENIMITEINESNFN